MSWFASEETATPWSRAPLPRQPGSSNSEPSACAGGSLLKDEGLEIRGQRHVAVGPHKLLLGEVRTEQSVSSFLRKPSNNAGLTTRRFSVASFMAVQDVEDGVQVAGG